MDRQRAPSVYNVPQWRFSATLATIAAPWVVLPPEENSRGMFLASAQVFAWQADDDPTMALLIARRLPTFNDPSDWFAVLQFSRGYVSHVAAGVIDRVSASINYAPETEYFVPPAHGVYVAPRVNIAGNFRGAVELYSDVEQAGR